LKQKLAAYGGGGLILYLIIHNACLLSVFVCIRFLGIDVIGAARSWGFHVKSSENTNVFGAFITAVLLNKMLVPLQLFVTILMAPKFVPVLQPLAANLAPKIRKVWPF
jgi:hypothetical protein